MFADANSPSKRNANTYTFSNTYDHAQRHRNGDKYRNSYDYTLSDSYGYGQANAYGAASPNTETTSHAGAAPLKQPALVSWRWRFLRSARGAS